MRKLLLPLFLLSSLIGMTAGLNSVLVVPPGTHTKQISVNHISQLTTLKVKDIEKKIGRRLTIKEKVGLFILKTTRFAETKDAGKTALIFGIVGASLLLIGLFVPYVILGAIPAAIVAIVVGSSAKRKNPDDRKAHAATLLGWLTLALFALLLLIALIVVASWGGIF